MSARRRKSKRRATSALRAVDLFAGCGGLTLGLVRAGFKVIGAVENDPLSFESYEMNHKDVQLWKQDIRTLSTRSIKRALGLKKGELDLLAGCPPCQGFSTLVTNNGCYLVDDPRNSLIYEFLRFVEDLMPRSVLMENVPDLGGTTRFRRFHKRMRDLGYKCRYQVLDAAHYGVPQRRRRFVFVAVRDGDIELARKARVRKTVRDAFAPLKRKRKRSDLLHDKSSKRTKRVQQLIKKVPKDGGSRRDIKGYKQLDCHANFDGFYDIYGRMSWDKASPTITSGFVNPSKGRFIHPNEDRPITLREGALLQTFPRGYKISMTKGKYSAAALIGNAFPPEFARRQALSLGRHLRRNDGS